MCCHLMILFTRCLTTVSNTTQLDNTTLPTVNLVASCVSNRNTNVDVFFSKTQHKKVTKPNSITKLYLECCCNFIAQLHCLTSYMCLCCMDLYMFYTHVSNSNRPEHAALPL